MGFGGSGYRWEVVRRAISAGEDAAPYSGVWPGESIPRAGAVIRLAILVDYSLVKQQPWRDLIGAVQAALSRVP